MGIEGQKNPDLSLLRELLRELRSEVRRLNLEVANLQNELKKTKSRSATHLGYRDGKIAELKEFVRYLQLQLDNANSKLYEELCKRPIDSRNIVYILGGEFTNSPIGADLDISKSFNSIPNACKNEIRSILLCFTGLCALIDTLFGHSSETSANKHLQVLIAEATNESPRKENIENLHKSIDAMINGKTNISNALTASFEIVVWFPGCLSTFVTVAIIDGG